MIKKTYVRVITLLLVALMILGVMAPAFTRVTVGHQQ